MIEKLELESTVDNYKIIENKSKKNCKKNLFFLQFLLDKKSYPCYYLIIAGDHGRGAIPVPIPNTEVKPSNADDTASAGK